MFFNRRKILASALAGLLVIAGCIHIKPVTIKDSALDSDLSGGKYESTAFERGEFLDDDKGAGGFAIKSEVIYADEWPLAWGFETVGACKDFSFTTEGPHSGTKAMKLTWKKGPECAWIGWGGSWRNWEAIDLSGKTEKMALVFYVKNLGTAMNTLPIVIGVEDYADKGAYAAIGGQYIAGDVKSFDSDWRKVVIPLSVFNFQSNGVNPGIIKQFKFSFESSGSIMIDDISLEPHENKKDATEPGKNAAPKEMEAGKGEQVILFADEFPKGGWGFESDNCKQTTLTQADKYEGTTSFAYSWEKTPACKWIGVGFSWSDWVAYDLSKKESTYALQMRLKNLEKPNDGLPLVIGLEDYAGKSSYMALDSRFIPTDEYTGGWNKVVIPLSLFDFKSNGVNPAAIKQIIFQGEGKGNVLLDDIRLVPFTGNPQNPHGKRDISMEHVNALEEVSPSTNGVFVGAFTPGQPTAIQNTFASLSGRKPASVMWYENWAGACKVDDMKQIIAKGCIPHVVWEPNNGDATSNTITLSSIIAGKQDDYIRKYAEGCAKVGGTIHLRPFHEFNGNWYPWSTSKNGNDPQKHIEAWRHMVSIFRKVGAKNVQFVWCFNNGGVPNEKDNPWNDPYKAYPGDDWVDWVSLDAYNWGENNLPGLGSYWALFRELFENHYLKMAKTFPNKPIMIGEFASNQSGGDKAQWFLDMQDDLKNLYPRIKNYNYFHINKETDWRINSSKETQEAFKTIMADTFSRSSAIGLARVPAQFKTDFPDQSDVKRTEERLVGAKERDEKRKINAALANAQAKKVLVVDRKTAKMVLDGKIEAGEYNSAPARIENHEFYVAYDNEAVYIAGIVLDQDPLQNSQTDANIWNGDALEVTIGFDPNADVMRMTYGAFDQHFAIKMSSNPILWSWTKNARISGATVKTVKTDVGYTFEAKIPFASLGGTPFKPGVKLTGELALDEGDDAGRRTQKAWNSSRGGFNQRPFLWGYWQTNPGNAKP